MAITMTESAVKHIKKQLNQRGKGQGIRLAVRKSGCSGMKYVLEFVDKSEQGDQIFKKGGVSVFIDPKSLVFLKGTELDFVREGINEGFLFKNPNAGTECGCGESFNV